MSSEETDKNEVDEIYKRLLVVYVEKGFINPEGVLKNTIKMLVDEGRTREEAILHLWKKEDAGTPKRYDNEQQIEQFKEKIKRLAVLFSKGEISEESYKTSVKSIEENIDRLRRGVEIPTVREPTLSSVSSEEPRPPSVSLEYARTRGWAAKPTGLWWLVPFFFGIIGGIVAYVGVKDDDAEMASGLLLFGIVWSVICGLIWYAIVFS
jgi:hypothetical protein